MDFTKTSFLDVDIVFLSHPCTLLPKRSFKYKHDEAANDGNRNGKGRAEGAVRGARPGTVVEWEAQPLLPPPLGGDQASVMRRGSGNNVYLPHGHNDLSLCASSTISPGCCLSAAAVGIVTLPIFT